jgi:hypothetical protein
MTMNIRKAFLFRRGISVLAGLVLLPLAFASLTLAQTDELAPGKWWNPASDGDRENGKLAELVNKKKVYVVTSFTDSRTISEPSPTRNGDVHRLILEGISTHKDLQVVPVPSQADFAIVVRASATTENGERPPNLSLALDPSTAVGVEVLVLIPGSKQLDGTIHPRVVWESYIADAQVEAQAAARSTVDGFLWELSKLKQKSATKAK